MLRFILRYKSTNCSEMYGHIRVRASPRQIVRPTGLAMVARTLVPVQGLPQGEQSDSQSPWRKVANAGVSVLVELERNRSRKGRPACEQNRDP
eukprot:gene14957-biopygen20153